MNGTKPRVITVYLSKGGVAKSTLTSLLGLFLAGLGFRVVIIDLDRQGSQSQVFDLVDEEGRGSEVLHLVLQRRIDIASAMTGISPELIPSYNPDARGELSVVQGGPQTKIAIDDIAANPIRYKMGNTLDILRGPVARLAGVADFVVVDMGPSDQITALAGLVATDHLVIPTTMDYLSVARIAPVMEEIEVARDIHPELEILGILPVMTRYYFGGLRVAKNVQAGQQMLNALYGPLLFKDGRDRPVDIPYHEDWNNVRWTGESVLTSDVNRSVRDGALKFLRAIAERIGIEQGEVSYG